jgi:hypothetical protein
MNASLFGPTVLPEAAGNKARVYFTRSRLQRFAAAMAGRSRRQDLFFGPAKGQM